MMNQKVAILDLGTNTFHMIITELLHDGYSVIYREKIDVKIGQGGISKGYITNEAIKRALKAMVHFKAICDKLEVNEIHANATSAFRNAQNGIDVAFRIERLSGIKVNIISGDKEAQLIYQGVKRALRVGNETSMILDIGGGSNEFIICNQNKIFWKKSFEIGAQRLLDKFHKSEPISAVDKNALEKFLAKELIPLARAIKRYCPTVLIGASGSFDSMGEMSRQQLKINKLPGQTEYMLPRVQLNDIHNQLIYKNREERLKIPGMIEMRVDMIVVASTLINYIVSTYNFEKIRISGYSLKEGILNDILNKIYYNQPVPEI